ncbi:hypothetical protein [Antrihabitans sp. YC2-6]|uniref:Rv1157c family protein n=1 Tax=Antrihabitans sp. YC2-6 TaxID=2799498 RepID=UPI0018F4D039|nr:hypothetical protein [Antrihabitans sp. YC2-6]MBJ8343669.1 hypothetical protein [Antrihabitans sp. YC2-6]
MHRTRTTQKAIAVFAIAAAAALAAPTVVHAEPLLPDLPGVPAGIEIPALPEGVTVDMLASVAPAILGAAAGPADVADSPQSALLEQLTMLRDTPGLPAPIKTIITSVIRFLDGSGGGGPEIPENGAPIIQQFLYPTVGRGCISDSADSVGTALAVSGPAQLPPPGPQAGQAGIVFTALGTAPLAPEQTTPLTITWLNIDNRKTETQTLNNSANINPEGPATLSVISNTGPGRVLAVISGGLSTQEPDAAPRTCTFLPTVGMFTVN